MSYKTLLLLLILLLSGCSVPFLSGNNSSEEARPFPKSSSNSDQSSQSFSPSNSPKIPQSTPSKRVDKPNVFNSEEEIEKIKKIARQSTISITWGGKIIGSGVVIDYTNHEKSPKIYILTAKHVIGIKPGLIDKGNGETQPEAPFKIINDTGKVLGEITHDNYDNSVKFAKNNIDLTIIELNLESPLSEFGLTKATLATNLKNNQSVYIFTSLPCSYQSEKRPKQQLIKGQILEKSSFKTVKVDDNTTAKGYYAKYNNNTVQGMSGSPVFDQAGRVVAIHAKTDKEKSYDNQTCQELPSEPNEDYGYDNWGISIAQNWKNYTSYLPSDLSVDDSPLIAQQNPSLPSEDSLTKPPFVFVQPSPSPPTCPPFIGVGESCP